MNFLFIHNNFPAQFVHVARALAGDSSHKVAAIGSMTARPIDKVHLARYRLPAATTVATTHPFARRFDLECRRAEQVLYAMTGLKAEGFVPDVIVAHPGWGEALPLRTICPTAKIVEYCEYYYSPTNSDLDIAREFDEFGTNDLMMVSAKNAATLLAMVEADHCITPTEWQKSTFPAHLRSNLEVLHDGIDTEKTAPDPTATVPLESGRILSSEDEVVTYVARNLEPYRGYHSFVRALPKVLASRPQAQVLIVGGNGVSYGAAPRDPKQTWQQIFWDEVKSQVDVSRVHFLGRLSYERYVKVLQVSSCHVYLTYPFVLSWSMLEAMSAECLVVASDTGPVSEVIEHGKNGFLVPFFDTDAIAEGIADALANRHKRRKIRQNARKTVVDRYDLNKCLPRMLDLVTT